MKSLTTRPGSQFLYTPEGDMAGVKDGRGRDQLFAMAAPDSSENIGSLFVGGQMWRQRQSIAAAVGDITQGVSSASSLITRRVARLLDFDIGAIRLRVYNGSGSAITSCKAGFAVSPLSDTYGTSATWTQALFSGSGTFTSPAGSGTYPDHTFGVIDSDVAYIDGIAGQLLHLQIYEPSAGHTRMQHPTRTSPTMSVDGIVASTWAGDGVATPGSYVATYTGDLPRVHAILYPKKAISTWVAGGASTCAGQGDSAGLGWVRRTQKLAEQAGRPISTMNIGHAGAQTGPSLARVIQAVQGVKPTYASWFPFSTNDAGLGLSDIPRLQGQALAFLDACASVGTVPVLVTFQPNTVVSGNTLTVMQTLNQYCRDLAANGSCMLLDFQLLFSGSTTGTTWLDAADTADGLHKSPQGHAKAAVMAFDVLF